MSFQTPIQRAPGQPKRFSRVAHVAARPRQRFLNQHTLHILETHLIERTRAVTSAAETKIARANRVALRQQHGALDRVIELAHVAGPGMTQEQLHRARRKSFTAGFLVTRSVASEKMRGKERNVLATLAERRQTNLDGVDAKQQILSEATRFHFSMDIGIRRRDDADIGTTGAGRPDALELAGLEDAQQLRLLRQRQVADLVEKQRAALGQLEPAHTVRFRIRECAPHMAEELAL